MMVWCSTETTPIVRPSAAALTDLLYRVEQHRRALVTETAMRHGVGFTQWMALDVLFRLGPCTMTQLAQASVIDRTSLTRTVDGLIARGWVTRAMSAHDRRAVIVEVSDAGQPLARELGAEVAVLERRLLSAFDDREQDRLARDLDKLLTSWALPPSRNEPVSRSRSA